jgi:DNA-binding GntR family transcriptional regulator
MSIDHEALEPLYIQLARIIRDKIASGEYQRRIPAAKSLAQEHGVAQGTAERALDLLRTEGLIQAHVGRGWFVVPPSGT